MKTWTDFLQFYKNWKEVKLRFLPEQEDKRGEEKKEEKTKIFKTPDTQIPKLAIRQKKKPTKSE